MTIAEKALLVDIEKDPMMPTKYRERAARLLSVTASYEDDVYIHAEFNHMGRLYRIVTWRSDGHTRLRFIVLNGPDDDPESTWQMLFVL